MFKSPSVSLRRLLFSTSFFFFWRVRASRDKCLLASSCLSVRLCACVSPASNRRILGKFHTGDFLRISVDEIEIWLNRAEVFGTLHEEAVFFIDIPNNNSTIKVTL